MNLLHLPTLFPSHNYTHTWANTRCLNRSCMLTRTPRTVGSKEKTELNSNKPQRYRIVTYQEPSRASALVDCCYKRAEHDPVRWSGHHAIHWRTLAGKARFRSGTGVDRQICACVAGIRGLDDASGAEKNGGGAMQISWGRFRSVNAALWNSRMWLVSWVSPPYDSCKR